jgi:protein-tyrosine phosphatase
MIVEIPFELSGKVFRSVMPFGPYDRNTEAWNNYKKNNINVVVILAEKQEYLVHAKRDLLDFYQFAGLEVIHFPILDYQVPEDMGAFRDIIDRVLMRAKRGGNIAVHCLAGIGRTGTFLACLAKQRFGFSGQEAIDWIRQIIPGSIERLEQEKFVLEY